MAGCSMMIFPLLCIQTIWNELKYRRRQRYLRILETEAMRTEQIKDDETETSNTI